MTALDSGHTRPHTLTRRVEGGLRVLGGPRLGAVLLLIAAVANLMAAAAPAWRWLLDSPGYLALVGGIVLSGMASTAVRTPAAWREWRQPSPLAGGQLMVVDVGADGDSPPDPARLELLLRQCGYRVRRHDGRSGWRLAGVRHGWSSFAGITSHLSFVVLVAGAAIGTAFSEETRFGLFPGEQSFLAAPRPGLTSALRFDRLDAAFDDGGLPVRFDTYVTFIRDGVPIRPSILRVNEPADFDGHLVHAWTYGPAVSVRVEDLGGGVLFDGWVALGGESSGSRAPFVELPQLGMTIGVAIADAEANTLAVAAADDTGRVLDTAVVGPGGRVRIGPTTIELDAFSSYVTFMSRRDPGVLVVFVGAGLLCASLAAAFYWPRRRIDLVPAAAGVRLRIRGERFDDLRREAERLGRQLTGRIS